MRSIKYALLLIVLACCCHATLVNQGSTFCSSGSALTCPLTLGWSPAAGNTLVVMCVNYGTSTGLPTATDSGSHSYAQITTGDGLITLGIPTVFYYHNIAAGITDVTCNWSTGDYLSTFVQEFSGNLTLNAAATTAGSLAAATNTSNAVTALAGDLLVGFVSSGGNSAFTAHSGGGYTLIPNAIAAGMSGGLAYQQLGTAGSYTVTFDNGGVQNVVIGLIAFTPAGGASNSATPSHGVTM